MFLSGIMTLWGITTCCMAKVETYGQLVALRVVLGVLEAGELVSRMKEVMATANT